MFHKASSRFTVLIEPTLRTFMSFEEAIKANPVLRQVFRPLGRVHFEKFRTSRKGVIIGTN